jgi:trehalose 6-phosphate synthase
MDSPSIAVVGVQVAVPSRSHLEFYKREEELVDTLTEQVNWHWGTNNWKPVILLKQHHDHMSLMGLYRACDFCAVNSLHDGMNLVAKEFVASRLDGDGVLILSRFTGAFRELPDAIGVNPFAIQEMSDAILKAVTMPPEERRRRMARMREVVANNNVHRWAGKILSTLLKLDLPGLEAGREAGDARI